METPPPENLLIHLVSMFIDNSDGVFFPPKSILYKGTLSLTLSTHCFSGSSWSRRGAVWRCCHDEHTRNKVCFRDGLWAESGQANSPKQDPDQRRELQNSSGTGLRSVECGGSEAGRGEGDAGGGDGIRFSSHEDVWIYICRSGCRWSLDSDPLLL